jgi:hypothetical protein
MVWFSGLVTQKVKLFSGTETGYTNNQWCVEMYVM